MKNHLEHSPKNRNWWSIFKSTFGAMIGVQSTSQYEHDNEQTVIWPYVVMGLVLASVFVLILVVVVHLVI